MSDDLLKRLSYFAFKLEGKGQLESAASDAMAEAVTRLSANRVAIEGLRAEVERLRAALAPLAALHLWPDDVGEHIASDIRSDEGWDEKENDDSKEDLFVRRGDIRAARKALEGGR